MSLLWISSSWSLDAGRQPGSTDSTPVHKAAAAFVGPSQTPMSMKTSESNQEIKRASRGPLKGGEIASASSRSHSLPPSMKHRSRYPTHGALSLLFAQPSVKTYRFHSGLGGDVNVHELMLESKLAYTFPQQLL